MKEKQYFCTDYAYCYTSHVRIRMRNLIHAEGRCLWVGWRKDILKRRLLNVVCDSLKLRNFLVISPSNNQWMSSGCVNPEYTARRRIVPVLHIRRGLRLFFYWLQALRRPKGAWRTSDLHAFFMSRINRLRTNLEKNSAKLTFFVQIMTK